MPKDKERNKLLIKANTYALTRLRKEYYSEYRAFYHEELAKMGITLNVSQIYELKAEIRRLEKLLIEKGVGNEN